MRVVIPKNHDFLGRSANRNEHSVSDQPLEGIWSGEGATGGTHSDADVFVPRGGASSTNLGQAYGTQQRVPRPGGTLCLGWQQQES